MFGRLSNLGPSDPFNLCHFVPFNGNLLKVQGQGQAIPPGRLASSGGVQADYRNASVDKVPGQVLADGTFYFVYAYMKSGVMTIDFSQTPHEPDANGQEAKVGDHSCALIGCCRIKHVNGVPTTYGGARGQTISSWFGRFDARLETAVLGSNISGSTPQPLPDHAILQNGQPYGNFLEWVQWFDQAPRIYLIASAGNTRAGNTVHVGIGLNTQSAVSGFAQQGLALVAGGYTIPFSPEAPPLDFTGYVYARAMVYETPNGGAGAVDITGRMYADGVMV